MQKMQELDYNFNTTKATFHLNMEKSYEQMSSELISQCDTLKKEQNEYRNKVKMGTLFRGLRFHRELTLFNR